MIITPDPQAQPTSGPELRLQRTSDAPRALVSAAWTQGEHTKRWFVPKGCTLLESEGGLRVGGAWRMAMLHPDGEEFRAGGGVRGNRAGRIARVYPCLGR